MTTLHDVEARPTAPAELTQDREADEHVNISDAERLIAGVVGGALAARAVVRPARGNLLLGLLGGVLVYRSASGYCPLYGALGINMARQGDARPHDYFENGIHVEVAYTIAKPADELYRFWRDFENLPRFMGHLDEVRMLGHGRSHWVARAPAGTQVEWDAQIINEEENSLIAWRSLPGADVDNAGSVRFLPAPGGRGTEVHVVIEYIPPAGRLGKLVAQLFGEEPKQQISQDLRRLKQLMETGEIPTTQGQPRGTCG